VKSPSPMPKLRYLQLLTIIGILMLLIGSAGNVSIQGNAVTLPNTYIRILIATLGGLMAVCSFVLEVKSHSFLTSKLPQEQQQGGASRQKAPAHKTDASEFFYNSDDDRAETFTRMTHDAKRVWVLARTGVNLLNSNASVMNSLLKHSCEINLLFTDPSSDATRNLYGGDSAIYWLNIQAAARHVGELRTRFPRNFHVNIMPHAPTMSMVIVESNNPEHDFIRVMFYFIHSAYGNDRPMFKVLRGDRWFDIFKEEFTQLWGRAVPWDNELVGKCPVKL
jgi:hypothetical protein